MRIEYRRGDFIDAEEAVILHGCNTQGVMGRGAAKCVKERLPWAYEAYRSAYNRKYVHGDNCFTLGAVVWAFNIKTGERPRIVGNMLTQEYWQPEKAVNGRNLSYAALGSALDTVNSLVRRSQDGMIMIPGITPITRIGMVKIGAGLAGGDWDLISAMIEGVSADLYKPVVYTID